MSKEYVLYMSDVTEHEYEEGWGASVRPDGVVFCEDKHKLIDKFSKKYSYNLFETISDPKLIKVSKDCIDFYNYKKDKDIVLWLRRDSLKEFMKGVEL